MKEKQDVAARRFGASVHLAGTPFRRGENSDAWSCSDQLKRAIAASAIDDNHLMDSWNRQDALHLSSDTRLLVEHRHDN
jgi:hypothetical protein